jgi:hypothetical protein
LDVANDGCGVMAMYIVIFDYGGINTMKSKNIFDAKVEKIGVHPYRFCNAMRACLLETTRFGIPKNLIAGIRSMTFYIYFMSFNGPSTKVEKGSRPTVSGEFDLIVEAEIVSDVVNANCAITAHAMKVNYAVEVDKKSKRLSIIDPGLAFYNNDMLISEWSAKDNRYRVVLSEDNMVDPLPW